jgi:uncharacterized protein (DUF302 family)
MTDSNTTHTPPSGKTSGSRRWLLSGLIGIVIGAAGTGLAAWALMPSMMIDQYPSQYGLDETVSQLKAAVKKQGWVVSGVRNMNTSLAKHDVDFPRQVRLVEICHPQYAESILSTDRHLATLMPCAFAVYEGDDGQVYVSGMNTGLMGKLFGGNVADVMGGSVAADEHEILSTVIKTD